LSHNVLRRNRKEEEEEGKGEEGGDARKAK
jgi:hypothetical protein